MRKYSVLPIFFIFTVCLLACSAKNVNKSNEGNQTDTICVNKEQLLLDSIFACGKIHYANSALYHTRLNGHVKSISFPSDENSLYFRFDFIEFREDGTLSTIKSNDESLNIQEIEIDDILGEIVVDIDEDICLSTLIFDFKRKDTNTYNYNAEGFDLTYTIEYSPDGDPKKIVKVEKEANYHVDGDGMSPTEYTEIFDVKVVKKDNKGNWLTLSLSSPKSNQVINRNIQYYEDVNEIPKLIETISQDKIFFSLTNEYDNYFLRYYDKTTGIIHKFIPQDYEDFEVFGYKDYKIVDNNLYLIFETGNSGALAYNCVEAVYSYNLVNHEWKEISYCAEGCKFAANMIIMPFYDDESDKIEYKQYEMK